MDELGFYVNSISVISRRWKGEHERLCAMKRRLGSGRISPPAEFEPATPWSEVGSANRSATRTLHDQHWPTGLRDIKVSSELWQKDRMTEPQNSGRTRQIQYTFSKRGYKKPNGLWQRKNLYQFDCSNKTSIKILRLDQVMKNISLVCLSFDETSKVLISIRECLN